MQKDKEIKATKKKMKDCSLVSWNGLIVQISKQIVQFPNRWAPPQQIWHQSDKRSQSYECVKTLFLLSTYMVCAPQFLGPHNALPCVLISKQSADTDMLYAK